MNYAGLRRVHHVAGVAIVLAWAFTMGRMGWTRYRERGTAPELSVGQLLAEGAGETRTFGVYNGDAKIGYAASRRMKTAGGYLFADQAIWEMTLQGTKQRLVADSQAVVGEDFGMKTFRSRVDAGVAKMSAQGRVEGNVLVVRFDTAGRSYEDRQPLDGPALLPALVRPAIAARNPKPGSSYVLSIFNPLARGIEQIEVLVEGRETIKTAIGDVNTWRIQEILRGSIKTQVWIDDAGDTVREISPLGMRMEVEPREKAISMPAGSGAVPDLIVAVRVPVKGDLETSIASGRVIVDLDGVDLEDFPLLAGGRQIFEGTRLAVDSLRTPVAYPLPYSGGDHDADLAPESLIQSTDPEIVATARKIVAGAPDSVVATRRIQAWVHDTLRKENSAGIPSAVEVLQTKSGDCNEHTVLFVALARAAGIPARMAIGVVWANARGAGPGVYYHAWPEVYLGQVGSSMPGAGDRADGWYAVDPTLGQIPADAGHLRFLVGGLEKQVDLLKLIGHLSIVVTPPGVHP